MARPRVIDLSDPRSADAPPFVCPDCGAALDWIRKPHLDAVTIECRCHKPRHSHVVYEVRCRACAEIIVLRDASTGYVIVGRGSTTNATDRAAAVLAAERRFSRDDDR